MTSKEFVLWLKGFTEGVHEFNITPKQWDILKEKLAEVEDKVLILESKPSFPFGTSNGLPFITPPPTDPYNPYKITCTPGTTSTPGMVVTTTPGSGSITFGNPPFGFGSTSTAYGYPSGSAWSYTNSTDEKIF